MAYTLRDYQQYAVDETLNYYVNGGRENGIIVMPTGCHAKDHSILMFDGSTKLVQDIQVGDLLMGPDSTARSVLALARGRQEMRRVVPVKGEPFVVNLDHKLNVKHMAYRGKTCFNETITIREYEEGTKWNRHLRKLRRVGVEFAEAKLPLSPYFMGLMLGDGSLKYETVTFSGSEHETLSAIQSEALLHGCELVIKTKTGTECLCVTIKDPLANRSTPNRVMDKFRALHLNGTSSYTVFIPEVYKVASREQRLQILAGLIDSDGYLDNNCYEHSTMSVQLANDVKFLCRSLGLAAYTKPKDAKLNGLVKGTVYRTMISGDVDEIPVRIPYKKAKPRTQIKDVLCTGFSLEKLPEDDFYGFTLDKDHLYLDAHFNVHHNTGKSLVIAEIVKRVCGTWPGTRIMMLTHVKELVEQNYEKLIEHWSMAPAGIYSASIGRKEDHFPITFGGVQSVYKSVHKFGRVDILIVDECHRMSPTAGTTYDKTIKFLKKVNPYLIVIGLTATPYRLKGGYLTDTDMFDRILVDMSTLESFNWFLEQGYLAYLKPYVPSVEIDLTGVGKSGGDFKQNDLQKATDKEWITKQAVAEMAQAAEEQGREHWLVFGTGVDHVEHIVSEIQAQGYTAVSVHSKMSTAERDANVQLFLDGKVTALVNMSVLTTGFDAPFTDLIGMLRATTSASLWVQMLGRGTRPYFAPGFDLSCAQGRLDAIAASSKPDCLVLDFAGNTKRLGCINDPLVPVNKKKGSGEAPVRDCPECHFLMHASLRVCPECGKEFPPEIKFEGKAGGDELIARKRKEKEAPEVHVFDVESVFFTPKQGRAGKPSYVELSYMCGMRRFKQPLCFQHEGFALKKARDWWRKATGVDDGDEIPTTVDEALHRQSECMTPKKIRVWVNKKYPEILTVDYTGELSNGIESTINQDERA